MVKNGSTKRQKHHDKDKYYKRKYRVLFMFHRICWLPYIVYNTGILVLNQISTLNRIGISFKWWQLTMTTNKLYELSKNRFPVPYLVLLCGQFLSVPSQYPNLRRTVYNTVKDKRRFVASFFFFPSSHNISILCCCLSLSSIIHIPFIL